MANDDDEMISPERTFGVQKGLGWTVILIFSSLLLALLWRVVWFGDIDDVLELLKQAANILFNITLLIVGYWFGSSKSSQGKDQQQTDLTMKMIEKIAPGGGTGNGTEPPKPPVQVIASPVLPPEVEADALKAVTDALEEGAKKENGNAKPV